MTTGKTASADNVVYHGVGLDDDDQGVSFVLPFERRGHYATRELLLSEVANNEVESKEFL